MATICLRLNKDYHKYKSDFGFLHGEWGVWTYVTSLPFVLCSPIRKCPGMVENMHWIGVWGPCTLKLTLGVYQSHTTSIWVLGNWPTSLNFKVYKSITMLDLYVFSDGARRLPRTQMMVTTTTPGRLKCMLVVQSVGVRLCVVFGYANI